MARKPQRHRTKPETALSPPVDVLSRELSSARALWQSGDHSTALRAIRRSIASEPHNVRGYLEAARCYAESFEFRRSREVLHKLRALAPDLPGVHHAAGEMLAALKLPLEAMACFESAAKLSGVLPRTLVSLAAIYERLHRMDEARGLLDRAAAMKSELPDAVLLRATIETREGNTSLSEKLIRDLLTRVAPDSDVACQAWAELALLYDGQQQYAEAWTAIHYAHRPLLARDAQTWHASELVLARFGTMLNDLTQEEFATWQTHDCSTPPRKFALLTGFPRSGTTLLEQLLDAHHDIVSIEERDYLAQWLIPNLHDRNRPSRSLLDAVSQLSSEDIARWQQNYIDAMAELLHIPIESQLVVDKNPAYNPVIPIMLRIFPNTKLIIALRDPRDVLVSCYFRYLPLNPVSVRFLTPERIVQRYTFDMRAWLKVRPWLSNPWCEVRYEETVDDLETTARKMLETLGVAWTPEVLQFRERQQERPVNSPSYQAVAGPVTRSAVGRWRNYEPWLGSAFDALMPIMKELGY